MYFKLLHYRLTAYLSVFLLMSLLLSPIRSIAQDPILPPGVPDSSLPRQALRGWLHIIYGDPVPNSDSSEKTVYLLTDDNGQILSDLALSPKTARLFNGQHVDVVGRVQTQLNINSSRIPLWVESIKRIDSDAETINQTGVQLQESKGFSGQDVSGSQPWLIALCRFPENTWTPHPPAWYIPLFSSAYPGLDHYWRQLSYNKINLIGTQVVTQWYTLPYPRSHYVSDTPGAYANLQLLAADCSAAMDSSVYFPQYAGINFLFNDGLDCCAWGGSVDLTRDGQTRSYRATWMPYNTHRHDYFGHEMGHGFGYPHSSGPFNAEIGESGATSSWWDMMSNGAGTCAASDPNFDCLSNGTIANNLDIDNWIPSSKRVLVWPGEATTVTLERLRLPDSNTNALIAIVPINGAVDRYYTVESRRLTGYDQNTPGSAVIINEVDENRSNWAYVVDAIDGNDNVNDAGGMWLPGETYTDTTNNISVQVLSAAASSFTVRITNNSIPSPYPNPPSNLIVSQSTPTSITISWQDNAFNETGFNIYKWGYDPQSQQFDFLFYSNVGANQTSFKDQPLPCDSSGYYEVSAYNESGESPHDVWVLGLTAACSQLGDAPIRNYFTTGTPTLTWGRVTWAISYRLQVASDKNFIGATTYDVGQTLTFTLPSPLTNGRYYWRVQACSSSTDCGGWSAMDSFVVDS